MSAIACGQSQIASDSPTTHSGCSRGRLTPAAAQSFVLSTGVRFVLADCQTTNDMRKLLGPIIRSAHGFGCAAVYEVE